MKKDGVGKEYCINGEVIKHTEHIEVASRMIWQSLKRKTMKK